MRTRSQTIQSEDARRERVMLMLADVLFGDRAGIGCYSDYINRSRRRFVAKRLNSLQSRHHTQPPNVLTGEMEARILEK